MYKSLYNIFKHWYNGGSIYLYSDPHFSDSEAHAFRKNDISDEEQLKRINRTVGRNGTIIFLGDIGDIEYIKRIKGYKVLIKGNHDTGDSNYEGVFNEVYRGALTISDKLILSHEPIENLPPFWFNIHGHEHSGRYIDEFHLNICAEFLDFTPINLNNILLGGKLKNIPSIHQLVVEKRKGDKQYE